MLDYLIIDPASTEFNRGSFCYLPYILYSYLKTKGFRVKLVENFTCSNIDRLYDAKNYLVALWSYPQIDSALILNKFLPKIPSFFGYYPLIQELKFDQFKINDEMIGEGITNYLYHYDEFETILLSDCDMHLSKYEGQVYPLFTSYGCPNNCSFCPVSPNCNSKRTVLSSSIVIEMLSYCLLNNYNNIHFTDEDFFFDIDRAYTILNYTSSHYFNLIALGSVQSVLKFIDKYGMSFLKKSGIKLIEVGLETADSTLNENMGKKGISNYEKLARITDGIIDIFWLTMTFFPGETIKTLRATGLFLEKYGFELNQLYSRVKTNSTIGGLGQFFQLYVGTKTYKQRFNLGYVLNERPVRLLPSFIPYSFLDDIIRGIRMVKRDEFKWFKLYGLSESNVFNVLNPMIPPISISDIIYKESFLSKSDIATLLAISARLGIIE